MAPSVHEPPASATWIVPEPATPIRFTHSWRLTFDIDESDGRLDKSNLM
jgi:hypothetical protein